MVNKDDLFLINEVDLRRRDGTGSGFLTGDPSRPHSVVERCEANARQRFDSSISYLSGNAKRLVA